RPFGELDLREQVGYRTGYGPRQPALRFDGWRIQFNPSIVASSFDHLIRSCQHVRRNRQADLLRRLEIYHQLKFRRLLPGRSAGLAPFRILSTVDVREVRPVGLEPAGL